MDAEKVLQSILPQIKVPTPNSLIYKDECQFSFNTQESEGGILLDVITYLGFSPKWAAINFDKTGHKVYLNIQKKRVPKHTAPDSAATPTVQGLGVPGGFADLDKNFVYERSYAIVILPEGTRIPLPEQKGNLPMKLVQVVDALIELDSASHKADVSSFVITEELRESKFVKDLIQLDTGKKISSHGWKCGDCDKADNLWLNLSDGHIGCGRKNFDGSGGNGHALSHYKETGFPIVVKLGTITPDGIADVFSYHESEDDMVLDPYLENHLKHWGIDMSELRKTDKSVAELSIELQKTFDWTRVSECSSPLYGPGFTGIENLGNTCYMASVLQTLFTIPEFQDRYYANAQRFFRESNNPPKDFHVQMSKVADGLLSGEHSRPVEKPSEELSYTPYDEAGITPRSFKSLVGEGHPEFSTNRQQDAAEFFQYLLQLIERHEHAKGDHVDVSKLFQFNTEDRLQCTRSNQVRYSYVEQNMLSVGIPLELAVNKDEVAAYEAAENGKSAEQKEKEKLDGAKPVRPIVKLTDCLDTYGVSEEVDFFSPAVNERVVGIKSTRLSTMPEYLVVQIRKFNYSASWVPTKIDVLIDAPDQIDLEKLRGKGLQEGEVVMKDEPAPAAAAPQVPLFNEEVVQMLMMMDIPRVRAERASHNTMGQDADAAVGWLFSHLDDPNIDTPLQQPSGDVKAAPQVDEAAVSQIIDMGFTRVQAIKALGATNNSVERAMDWLFSHGGADDDIMDVDQPQASVNSPSTPVSKHFIDGPEYELMAFITHLGTSTMSGHYVAHIKKDGKWVLFNDAKVAEAENPPRDLAYLYIYKRTH